MSAKPIRLSMWRQRPGASARDRTYFRLDVDAAAALLSRILCPDGGAAASMTRDGVAQSLQAGRAVRASWHVDGAEWVLAAARVVEGDGR